MRSNIAEAVKEAVTMDEVIRFYGFTPNRAGFICCPFHGEKTPSLKVYKDHWHCFGCGAGGSIIDFVMSLFRIRFSAAVVRLNADFHLGLSSERPDSAETAKYKAARARAKAEAERREREYNEKILEFRRLNGNYNNAPPDSDAYVEACHKLPALEAWFDEHPYTEYTKEARRSP